MNKSANLLKAYFQYPNMDLIGKLIRRLKRKNNDIIFINNIENIIIANNSLQKKLGTMGITTDLMISSLKRINIDE